MDTASNNDKVKKVEGIVNSAGNSWIICRSKSHSGRIYYFNTLTGEAAWNLSDNEVKKAKSFISQENGHSEVYPEPEESPKRPFVDYENKEEEQAPGPSRIYNKQIINNQFPKPSFKFMVPSCTPMITNPMNPIMPMQFSLDASNTGYNTNVWAVPSTHQIYIAPAVTPLMHQAKTSLNTAFKHPTTSVYIQNPSTCQSGTFQNVSFKRFNNSPHKRNVGTNKFSFRDNKLKPKKNNYDKKSTRILNSYDLRDFLSAKKNESTYSKKEFCKEISTNEQNNDAALLNTQKVKEQTCQTIEEFHEEVEKRDDVDDDWLEENIILDGTMFKLNIESLKKLAEPTMKKDCWYIVPDKDILLNHLHFLNILYRSDDDCRLTIPRQVLTELEELARLKFPLRISNRARRAVTFLKEQLKAGFIEIGAVDSDHQDEKDEKSSYLLNHCLNLSNQNYHVILLSDNNELETYKHSTQVYMFSLKEMKQFLTRPLVESEPEEFEVPTVLQHSPIKITIPNDLIIKPCEETTCNDVDSNHQVSSSNENHEYAAIESELVNSQSDSVSPIVQATKPKNQADSESSPIKQTTLNKLTESSAQSSKYEIQLNRSLFKNNQISNSIGVDKKHFRWRKRRAVNTVSAQKNNNKISQELTAHANSVEKVHNEPEKVPQLKSPSLSTDPPCNKSINNITALSSGSKNSIVNNSETRNNKVERLSTAAINIMSISDLTSESKTESSSVNNKEVVRNEIENLLPFDLSNVSFDIPSNKSIDDATANSETSSSIVNKTVENPKIVEETSVSGIISNTTSYVGSEITRNEMLEIPDSIIEDFLNTRREECVPRFLQIMEEVFTQVLRCDQKFLHDVVYKFFGGGPWTTLEAIECIKIKLRFSKDAVITANKLANIIIKASNNSDSILNLRSIELAEMCKYGAYLVETLQSVLKNCEDLITAKQALVKLLSDIENPDLYSNHDDNFDDNVDVTTENVNQSPNLKIREKTSQSQTNTERNELRKKDDNKRCYNLRARRSITNKTQPKQQGSPKKSFKTNLNLKRIIYNCTQSSESEQLTRCVKESSEPSSDSQNVAALFNHASENLNTNTDVTEPIFNSNFQILPEYENRIKLSSLKSLDKENIDDLVIGGDDDENKDSVINLNVTYNEQRRNESRMQKELEVQNQEFEQQPVKTATSSISSAQSKYNDITEILADDSNLIGSVQKDAINNNLTTIFSRVLKAVKEAFMEINKFCENSIKELKEPEYSCLKRRKIVENTEKVQALIDNFQNLLNKIYHRNTYGSENSIQNMLSKAGVYDCDISDIQLDNYRVMIAKKLKEADILQESISLIRVVANKKTIS